MKETKKNSHCQRKEVDAQILDIKVKTENTKTEEANAKETIRSGLHQGMK